MVLRAVIPVANIWIKLQPDSNYCQMKKFVLSIIYLYASISVPAQTNYNAKEAFNPQFYPYSGNDYRSAVVAWRGFKPLLSY